jgi:hypothetical protein
LRRVLRHFVVTSWGISLYKTKLCMILVLVSLFFILPAKVDFARCEPINLININVDGSIDPSTAPIQHNGDFYTFTSNISASIAIHKSNITLDGAGYTLQGNGGTGIDLTNNVNQVPSTEEIWNVTVRNLRIINFNFSVDTNGGGNDTFFNDYIANTTNNVQGGIFLWGCSGNNITHCTIIGQPAVYMHFVSSRNSIVENNLSGGLSVRLSGGESVDRNYWVDYYAKYPNASEVDSTDIGNTHYVFGSSEFAGGILQDNHPLVKPIAILDFPALEPTHSITQAAPAFPTWIILLSTVTVVLLLAAFVIIKRE